MTAQEILAAFDFVRVGPDPANQKRDIWVFQECLPHVRIYLPPDPCKNAVLYAIWDSGMNRLREQWGEHKTAGFNLLKPGSTTTFESAAPAP